MARIVGAALVLTAFASAVAAARAGPPAAAPALLVVHVKDSTGRPVRSAMVEVRTRAGSKFTWTEDGVAKFGVLPDGADAGLEMTLEVGHARDDEGRSLPLAPVETRLAPNASDVVVVLPDGRRITGRVVGPDGVGIGDVRLRVSRAPHFLPGAKDYDDDARSDPQGRFEFGGLADEEHVLETFPKNRFVPVARARVRAGASDVVVALRVGLTVDVRVLDAGDAPISGAFVQASGSSPSTGRATSAAMTDLSGIARLEGLTPEVDYVLDVEVPALDREDARIRHWKPRDETVRLGEARRIRGTVRDPSGRPLAGIRVVVDEGYQDGPPPQWSTTTSSDGTFAFQKVRPGELRVACRLWGDQRPREAATRVSADATSLDIVFDPRKTLEVHIENHHAPNKERRHAAILRCDDAGDPGYRHVHDVPEDGRVVFTGLRDGATYRLVVTAVEGWSAARGGLRAGEEVTVKLERGGVVRGRVLAPKGIHSVGVWVGGDPSIADTETKADGTFMLDGIPPGRWRIHAGTSYGGQGFHADGDVAAGDEIELTLEPR